MKGSVLIVGAGPAGMRASAELVAQGFKVFLVEEKPTIGGKMAQIDKMFPSNECSTCTILPRMLELTSNPDSVTIMAFAEVTGVEGTAGDFKVKVLKKPRYVDPMKCTACTDCFPVCPVGGLPMEFNFGRGVSKAIAFYSPFPPRKALINPEKCDYLLKGKCGDKEQPPCVEACKPEAINFDQKPAEVEINVGAIILAVGMDEQKDGSLEMYGYGKFPNVLTALEYERLLSGLGPTGGIVKRDDGIEPQSVAWMTVGSPSPIPFLTAVAEAMGTIERNPDASATILYENIDLQRESYDSFYQMGKERNINFIQIENISVTEGTSGNLTVSYRNRDKKEETLNAELFILAAPLDHASNTRMLAEKIGIKIDETGSFDKKTGVLHPLYTLQDGVFVCGCVEGSKGIDDTIVQACAAAANAASLLSPERGKEIAKPPEKELLPVKPEDEASIAVVICRCGMNIAGLLNIDDLAAYTASLPHVKKVEITPFGCDGVKVKELLQSKEYNRIVLGACSPKTHESLFQLHTEAGGLNRYLMEIVNLRNQCTWVHSGDKEKATKKAKTLMRMGIERASLLEALEDIHIPVMPNTLIIGGTPSGMACALKLAQMDFQVYLVTNGADLSKANQSEDSFVQGLIDEVNANEKVTIFRGTKVGNVEGYVGNYKANLINGAGNKEIDVGAIVIATKDDMGDGSSETHYENDLLLQRDEKGFFTGMLGILNPLDFNTEGVFRCGSAREEMSILKEITDGEGVASRVAGIVSKEEMIKDPTTSFVVDEMCDGCAYCIEPCPAQAITLIEYMHHDNTIKKTVDVNEAICRGCGICMATCPKKGIFIRHFKPEYFNAMIQSVKEGV